MKKVVFLISFVVIIYGIFLISDSYLSNAQNYISVEKMKNQMGDQYSVLVDFYGKIGKDEVELTSQVESLQADLQEKLDNSSYIYKLNYFIYYNRSNKIDDISKLLISESDYIDSLSKEERQRYIDIYNGVNSEQ